MNEPLQIVVSNRELEAAAIFPSKDENRFSINGVLVEIRPHKKPTLVATDGRRLVAIETKAEQEQEFEEHFSIIIRPDFIQRIVYISKKDGGKNFPLIRFEVQPGRQRLVASLVGPDDVSYQRGSAAMIDGEFPKWREVMPAKDLVREPVNEISLNTEYVADFGKAAAIMEAISPAAQMNLVGNERAIEIKLAGVENFYGLLMQCRLIDAVEYQPEFVQIVRDLPSTPVKAQDAPEQGQEGEDSGTVKTVEQEEAELKMEELVVAAEAFIRMEGKCSVEFLQRKLGIKAPRVMVLLEKLEELGVVGPSRGKKSREILDKNDAPLNSVGAAFPEEGKEVAA